MPAVSENLTAQYSTVLLIRVGDITRQWGDDWEYCVACCSNDGETCVLKGLKGDSRFGYRHKRWIFEETRRLGFVFVTWERVKDGKTLHRGGRTARRAIALWQRLWAAIRGRS